MREKRTNFTDYMVALTGSFTDDFVFIDESGININMERRYGRAPGSERVIDYAPVNTPVNTTVIAGMTTQGPVAWDTWQGGTTKERLLDWVQNTLLPALHTGQVVIWDNLRVHHSQEVLDLLRKARIPVLSIPPYSPDFNPIEMMWAKMKEILRKLRIRAVDTLQEAVRYILAHQIAPDNCRGWFRRDGYIAQVHP